MNSTLQTPILVNGKTIGKVTAGAFCKVIHGSKHLLRSPRAIALSTASLDAAAAAGANTIAITDVETGLVYSCTMAHFKRQAFDLQRGHFEPQRALTLDHWDVTGGKVAHQVEKNKRGKRTPAADEDPAYTAALELPNRQLTFDIFKNYRHD